MYMMTHEHIRRGSTSPKYEITWLRFGALQPTLRVISTTSSQRPREARINASWCCLHQSQVSLAKGTAHQICGHLSQDRQRRDPALRRDRQSSAGEGYFWRFLTRL